MATAAARSAGSAWPTTATDVDVDRSTGATGRVVPASAARTDASSTSTATCSCRPWPSPTPTSTRRSPPTGCPTAPATCSGPSRPGCLPGAADRRRHRRAGPARRAAAARQRDHGHPDPRRRRRHRPALRRGPLGREARALADLLDLQIVALVAPPVSGSAGADHQALLRAAMDAGADVVGGCPHLDPDPWPPSTTAWSWPPSWAPDRPAHGRDARPAVLGVVDLAADVVTPVRARRHRQPLRQPRHAGASTPSAHRRGDRRRRRRVVITLPQTNLFLQGRDPGGTAPGPHGAASAARRRCHGRGRRRQPAGSVQPRGAGRPAGGGLAAGGGRSPARPRRRWRRSRAAPARRWACRPSRSRPAAPAELLAIRAAPARGHRDGLARADRLPSRAGSWLHESGVSP